MELINISRLFNDADNNSFVENVNENREYYDQRLYYTIIVCVAVNVLLCFTALFGNAAILITLWKTPSLHSPANILLASLAVSDLAVGLVVQPLFITSILKGDDTFLVILTSLSVFLCSVSFYTTTAIGVDRLLALQLHLRYQAVVTPPRVTGIVTLIWVFSGLFSSAQFWISNLFYNVTSPLSFAFLVVNFGVYLKIYFIVRRHQAQIAHQQQQHHGNNGNIFLRLKKSAVNTFLVYIVLLVCYTPHALAIIFLFKYGSFSLSVAYAQIIIFTIVYLNSSINPLLYCWRIREIRTAMKQYFCC
ncbi:histamine H2 receptor-like [Oculina patagonica]